MNTPIAAAAATRNEKVSKCLKWKTALALPNFARACCLSKPTEASIKGMSSTSGTLLRVCDALPTSATASDTFNCAITACTAKGTTSASSATAARFASP